MKILITGATGFIGRNLLAALLKGQHDLICTVRGESNTDILEKNNARIALCDITDGVSVNDVFMAEKPDIVFHCAARVIGDKEDLEKTNIEGTRNICRASYENGVKRLVYLSSVAVVSGNPQVPLTDNLPYNTTNDYGKTKAEAEKIAIEYRKKGLKTAIIRPCMVYGEDEPHALDTLLKYAYLKRLPILNDPGILSKLNLVYVGNVVHALCLAMEKDAAIDGTFMIADRGAITIREFLRITYEELGRGRPIVIPSLIVKGLRLIPNVNKKLDRLFKDRVYDITRAVNLLEYNPSVFTEDGLRRTVKYWKQKHV